MEVIAGLPNCPLDKVVKSKGCSHQGSVSLLCNRRMIRFSKKGVQGSGLTTSYARKERPTTERQREKRDQEQ
jgi:hypothetical protein